MIDYLSTYYVLVIFFAVYIVTKVKVKSDLFLQYLLYAMCVIIAVRSTTGSYLGSFSTPLFIIFDIACLVYASKRFIGNTRFLLISLVPIISTLIYHSAALNPRSFETQLFGYLSISCALTYAIAHQLKLTKELKAFHFILLFFAIDSIVTFLNQSIIELTCCF